MIIGLFSCQKEFLQKPSTTGTTTIETVFSTQVNAEGAIAAAYRASLIQGLPYSGLSHGTLASLSGELSWGWNWHDTYVIINNGMSAAGKQEDDFDANYAAIRQDYLVFENIDHVKDMDPGTKDIVKAEMEGLIAYRYMGMFIRYGGIPITGKALNSNDDLAINRATLQETEDTIINLCDRAAKVLPDTWPDNWRGRLTKGVALAIKARTLMYAARPLFNATTPYLDLGEHNNLISFGTADQQRWEDAIAANEAVLAWAKASGHDIINTGDAGEGVPNPHAFVDYATATSVLNNPEVLLGYKFDQQYGISNFFNVSTYATVNRFDIATYGMETNFLTNYYKNDGTDQVWPGLGPGSAIPASEYFKRMKEMEPRFLADNMPHATDPLNNPGDQGWAAVNADFGVNQDGSAGKGDAYSVKYYYKAGSRPWFEFPLFRMAEIYLNLAEAYNETGNSQKALENLNLVHNRAGLPTITEADKSKLRTIIQREWAIEFYNENQRYFQVKHWKLPDIGTGIIGGPRREFQFTSNGQNVELPQNLITFYDQVVFQAYWAPKMFLDPFPQDEINKGIITQNPGY